MKKKWIKIEVLFLILMLMKGNSSYILNSYRGNQYISNNENTIKDTLTRDELSQLLKEITTRVEKLEIENTELKKEILNLNTTSMDEIYPVGSIYITTSNINPSTLFKNTTWERYGVNRTLLSTNENSKEVGGRSTISLTLDNLPNHNHSIPPLTGTTSSTGNGYSISYENYPRTVSSWTGIHSHADNAQLWANHSPSVSGNNYTTRGTSGYYMTTESEGGGKRATMYTGNASITVNGQTVEDYYVNKIEGIETHAHDITTDPSTTSSVGNGSSFSIQNPYITVYMWKRVS